MDNSKKIYNHPDNEKSPHAHDSLDELVKLIVNVLWGKDPTKVMSSECSSTINSWEDVMKHIKLTDNMYYDTDMLNSLINKKCEVTISPKAQNIPKYLEFALKYLCSSNSKDIKERCRFALYPPEGYRSAIERYYRLYNGKVINDEELELLYVSLYQKYLKSSK